MRFLQLLPLVNIRPSLLLLFRSLNTWPSLLLLLLLRSPRYQAKCDKLQLSNDQLEGKLSQQLEDQEQVITFLKRKSQEQTELNLDLEEKSMVLRQAKEKEVGGRRGGRERANEGGLEGGQLCKKGKLFESQK